jgi:hypothetical protein
MRFRDAVNIGLGLTYLAIYIREGKAFNLICGAAALVIGLWRFKIIMNEGDD